MKNITSLKDIGRLLYKHRYPIAGLGGVGVASLGVRDYVRSLKDKPRREDILKALKKNTKREDVRNAIKLLEKEQDESAAKKKILMGKLLASSPVILDAIAEMQG